LSFLGRLSHSELNELYLNYRIFVLSSNFEGNPKVVLEAMSRGVLVIARRNKNIEEIIENNHDGIIFDNSSEILSLVESFLDNKAEWERIVLNGYKKVKNNNLIDSIVRKEKEIYS
jgi:glycosyltransferase involved in cell wall biosynthesis